MQPWKSIIQAYCLLPILPNQVPSVNHVPVLFVTFGRLPAPEDETGTLLGKVGGEGEEKILYLFGLANLFKSSV